jgi:DNA-binding response OmpR family regulator
MKDLTILKNLNVLYVDDDVNDCKKLGKILNYYFASVETSSDVNEAMEIYKKGKCNLLLVDYDMPIMNGYEFLKEIRKDNDKIPAVIMSAYDDKDKLFNAIEVQLVSYLVKPYSMDELKDVFYKVLGWIEDKGLLEKTLCDGVKYMFSTKTLYVKEKEVSLSPSEFKMLEVLINNENKLVNYEQIKLILGDNCTHKSMVNQMHKLKKKLEVDIIKNIKDFGYIFTKK